MHDVVVCIRLSNGSDVLAFIVGEKDNKVMVEHPHIVKYDITLSKLNLIPYCLLSDETYFEIDRGKIEFVVTASEGVSRVFSDTIQSEYSVDTPHFEHNTAHTGNDTVH